MVAGTIVEVEVEFEEVEVEVEDKHRTRLSATLRPGARPNPSVSSSSTLRMANDKRPLGRGGKQARAPVQGRGRGLLQINHDGGKVLPLNRP